MKPLAHGIITNLLHRYVRSNGKGNSGDGLLKMNRFFVVSLLLIVRKITEVQVVPILLKSRSHSRYRVGTNTNFL